MIFIFINSTREISGRLWKTLKLNQQKLVISKKKWCIIFIYRPPKYDKKVFFQELPKTVSQATNKYDNILVAGDLHIDVSGSKGLNDNHFSELIDTFNLTNFVKTPTCFKTTRGPC